MDLGAFFQLIGTLFVGGLVMSGTAIGFWVILDKDSSLIDWFRKINLMPDSTIGAVLLAFIGFGFGVFGECLTDYMTDSESKIEQG